MGKVLVGVGAFGDVIHAETIDHTAVRLPVPDPAVSAEYGEYLVVTFGCRTCHGQELAGGKDPDPNAPPGPNLTQGGNLSGLSEEGFVSMIRNRKSEWMPYESLAKMTDDELKAISLYLKSLPSLENAVK